MADKQLESTLAAAAFQKQWFADLRRRVFDERQPYALLQADVPFELFDLLDIPAVSNQWWASMIAAKRQAPAVSRRDATPTACMATCAATAVSATPRPAIRRRRDAPWGGLPPPRLLCARLTCDCIQRVFALWAEALRRRAVRDRSSGRRATCRRAGGNWAGTGGANWSNRTGWHSSPRRLERLVERLEAISGRALDRDALRAASRDGSISRRRSSTPCGTLIATAPEVSGADDRADHQRDGDAMGARAATGRWRTRAPSTTRCSSAWRRASRRARANAPG